MPYLVAADLPTGSAGSRFRALLERPGILQMPGTHNGLAALQAKRGRLRGAVSFGRGDVGVDGPARSRRHHGRRGLLLHPPGRAGERPAGAGRRRHRLRRGAERHAHGARLRGGGRRRGPYRGPAPAQEMRPSQRQEARRRRTTWRPRSHAAARARRASLDRRPHRRGRERRHRRRRGARQALPRGRRRCDLSRGADQRRDVPRLRQGDAGREAARQHDRVRPHAVLHRVRIRGDGLPHGDLAGLGASASPTRRRRSSTPRSSATAARRT